MTGASPVGKVKITGFKVYKVTLRWRDLVFLKVETDAGLTGLGEATLEGRADLAETALRWLEEDFVERDPSGVEEHWNRAYYQLSRWRNGPAVMSAKSALEIALWDIEAKRLDVTLWRLLGGRLRRPRESITRTGERRWKVIGHRKPFTIGRSRHGSAAGRR